MKSRFSLIARLAAIVQLKETDPESFTKVLTALSTAKTNDSVVTMSSLFGNLSRKFDRAEKDWLRLEPEALGLIPGGRTRDSRIPYAGGLNKPGSARVSALYTRPNGQRLTKEFMSGIQSAAPGIQGLLQGQTQEWKKRKTIHSVKNRLDAILSLNKAFGIKSSLLN